MNEATEIPAMIDQHQADAMRSQAESLTGSVFDWSLRPLLNAQADLLADAESIMGDWLHRRHEAIGDTRQLIASMQSGLADPGTTLRTQQEVMTRSFRRMAADAQACQSVARRMVDHVPGWFPRSGWSWFATDTKSPPVY